MVVEIYAWLREGYEGCFVHVKGTRLILSGVSVAYTERNVTILLTFFLCSIKHPWLKIILCLDVCVILYGEITLFLLCAIICKKEIIWNSFLMLKLHAIWVQCMWPHTTSITEIFLFFNPTLTESLTEGFGEDMNLWGWSTCSILIDRYHFENIIRVGLQVIDN